MALSPLQMAALNGRDPSQRNQILDSRNLITSDYNAPNWMTAGNGTGMAGPEHGSVPLVVGNNYALYDNKTGKVLARGSSAEDLQNILGIINNQLVPQGNDADWRLLQMGGPWEGADMHTRYASPVGEAMQIGDEWGTPVAGDVPNNFFKDMLLPLLAVPAATAGAYFGGNALLGGLGGGGSTGAAGAAGAGGAGGAGGAVVPGATLGGGGGGVGGALGGVGLGTSTAGLTPIVVPGIKGGLTFAQTLAGIAPGVGIPGATAALGGGTGAGTGAGAGTSVTANPVDQIVATGVKGLSLTPTEIAAIIAGGSIPAAAGIGSGSSTGATSAGSATGGQPGAVGPNGEIVVTAGGKPINVVDAFINGTLTSAQIGDIANQLANQSGPNTPSNKPGTKVPYGRIISGILGGIGGASGGQPRYLGTGTRNPIFDAELPPPSLPGGVSAMTAREVPEQNWYEYGFNPEQSFFNTSAPGYTPKPGKTPGMAHGGEFAVSGPGDGRSDSIPARLSDGEYVIDAETVALLGNGSPKAGAERLDAFRVNVRKHKGRDLARGKFSVKAKRPEAYMAGGRT